MFTVLFNVEGDTLGERFVSALSVRRMQRTFPSSAFLLPYSAPHFWADDYPFIITHNRTYGIKDIPVLAKVSGLAAVTLTSLFPLSLHVP